MAPPDWIDPWNMAPQSDKYGLEKVCKFGGALPIPVKSNCVETVLRVELANPSTKALKLGYNRVIAVPHLQRVTAI
eukprot:3123698-Amphidinium_carterae.2